MNNEKGITCICGKYIKHKKNIKRHMETYYHYQRIEIKPFEYWFYKEDDGYIARNWNFDIKYHSRITEYHEFKGWDWNASNIGIKVRSTYIFVYRNYKINEEVVPDYENKDIYTEENPLTKF